MASTQPELPLFARDSGARGRIVTIPPSAPFLDVLARAVLSGDLPHAGGRPPGPLELADTQIYLPNRAACRALADAFLHASESGATLLPRIRPLGSAEEDSLLILYGDDEADGRPDLPVAPSIGALDRRMALTQLVLAWARNLSRGQFSGESGLRIADTPAAAAELALELMRLMDEAETEGVDLGRLRELVPERFAGHEQLSLSFLDIVLQAWPAYLAGQELLNPVDRRNRIMALETQRLKDTAPETPVIVAGSTGSIPATANLMKAIFGLPNGAIVLPGVDLMLDEAGWAAVADHPEHPQAGLHALLGELGAERADVSYLAGAEPQQDGLHRAQFISEAMRPASTLGVWPQFAEAAKPEAIRASLAPVSLIEAATEQEEAAAIALILREAMEVPGKTASLVTPDRTLARRITAELGRWGLALDATSGEMLRTTQAGVFYDLIAEAAATGSQIPLLALLKHPLTRLGLPAGEAHRTARIVEIAGMRQAWCGEGLDGLSKSLDLAKKKKPRHAVLDRLTEEEWAAAADLVSRLKRAFQPLTRLARAKSSAFGALAAAHADTAAALTTDETGERVPSTGPDSDAMAVFMAALCGDIPGPAIALTDYPALFRSLIRLEKLPGGAPAHPRLKILGAMEARLTSADLVVIAGMNEGVWPEAADPGPWLNRAMREALGLPPPERRTRLAAHDVCQLMGAPEIVLTRALKSGGAPTVPSRWLMRMQALLQGVGAKDALAPARPWLHWAAARNEAPTIPPAKPPAPCPPLDARPRRLSVSEIETLIANPYAIYARRILGLSPLNPLDAEPGGSERGQIIHDMLHRFARRYGDALPGDCAGELLALFDECAALYGDRARISAFWRPRLERFAGWFAETEFERRAASAVLSELRGEFVFETDGGPFTLHARADRIDLAPDGRLAIYDYKSGSMPTDAAAADFKAPQLPLEALIAIEGRFEGIASRSVAKLAYISAKGGEPAGLERALVKFPPDELARGARDGLFALIARFDRPDTPYAAMRRAAFTDAYRYDDYAHLARVPEWAGTQEEGAP
ncbi:MULTISPECIES: double-strand break repair protein AddB [Rhodomicrobium]|uniref:double-strand break repair protein AddB n=1 Tax=Rhodomicrobium TaxID=1068 RepID=UPI00148383F9|nr:MULTISPECIES: double-strand break repair protein AddB [Rhodomicrobium]